MGHIYKILALVDSCIYGRTLIGEVVLDNTGEYESGKLMYFDVESSIYNNFIKLD